MKKYKLLSIIVIGLFSSCVSIEENQAEKGIDVHLMDKNISPKNDFYHFVNGVWQRDAIIPADRTRWGVFDELRQKTDEDALAILKVTTAKIGTAVPDEETSDQQKAVHFFESIMDTVSRDKAGVKPLEPYLAKIESISNLEDLVDFIIYMEPNNGLGFFDFDVDSDLKNSNINAAYLSDAPLGLSRSYYVDEDVDTKEKLQKYEAHIARMFTFIGASEMDSKEKASDVLNFEIQLATPKLSKEERRDARNIYNPTNIDELSVLVPSVDWNKYFSGIGVEGLNSIIVTDPNYFKALEEIFKRNEIETWKNYLKWSLIDRSAGKLTTEIDKANWEFYSGVLRGAKTQRKRDERALQKVNSSIGEALGKLYVEKKFPLEAKIKAQMMIENIMKAFEVRINNVTWMSSETKLKAIEKLNKMDVKIGYPDKWKDYSDLIIDGTKDGGSYFSNSLHIAFWKHENQLKKLGKPVDKSEWHMSPQTVNAYFNPVNNEIVFPAAILQPPFYNYLADEAVNYGGIGAVIGHEISHCFDDSGARFDADGNLNDWWTAEDLKQFKILGQKLIDQYNAVEVLPDVYINGEFTLGENIGDLGGVNVAYDGLQIYIKENGTPKLIDGFTAEQRFYISWATVWRSKSTEDALRNQIKTDPHSPAMYRASLPQKNTEAFHKAFDIQSGDGMYLAPEDRVKIW